MGIEKERKFLVNSNILFHTLAGSPVNVTMIRQGYFGDNIRVRRAVSQGCIQGYITVKFPTAKMDSRYEFETEIGIGEAEKLLDLAEHQIVKMRFDVGRSIPFSRLKNTYCTVDCITNGTNTIWILETECKDSNEDHPWEHLQLLLNNDLKLLITKEVTNDPAYLNCNMAKNGIPK